MKGSAKKLNSEMVIRNFNLYLLSDIELEEPYKSMFIYLDEIFESLNKYRDCEHKVTSYGTGLQNLYIKLYERSKEVVISYLLWDVLEDDYDLYKFDVKEIIYYFLEYKDIIKKEKYNTINKTHYIY